MKECKHISDRGSTPLASTRMQICDRYEAACNRLWKVWPNLADLHPGGGVPDSTGCDEHSGGNRQATTADRTRYRAGRYGNHSVLIGAWRVLWNSANHKRQRQFVRAAYGCLISSQSGEAGSPGNRNQRIL